jgi:histidine triad (HIT) family protein
MSEKTIFKRIIDGEIPANILHDDEHCLAFHDIAPKAPTHFLVIPKKEIPSLGDVTPEDTAVLGHIMCTIKQLADQCGLTGGYRVITNIGRDGGQEVPHLHFHVLGGRKMTWPPG